MDEFGTEWNIRRNLSDGSDTPVLVFLHGFTGSGADFFPLLSSMEDASVDYMLIDLPGHGKSDAPENKDVYVIGNVVKVLHSLLLTVPKEKRVFLVGYSMGARITMQYLVEHPSIKAILIGGSPGLNSESERINRAESDSVWIHHLENPRCSMDEFCIAWESQSIIAPQTKIAEPACSEVAARRRMNSCAGLANALSAWGTGVLPGLWDKLGGLGELLLIAGENDHKFTRIARQMRNVNNRFRISEIPEAGHSPHLEKPAETAKVITDYLLSVCED